MIPQQHPDRDVAAEAMKYPGRITLGFTILAVAIWFVLHH